jgi:hypothetical protein
MTVHNNNNNNNNNNLMHKSPRFDRISLHVFLYRRSHCCGSNFGTYREVAVRAVVNRHCSLDV